MVLRMKNFDILGVHWKIQVLGGGFTKNQYSGVFEGGLIPQYTLWPAESSKWLASEKSGKIVIPPKDVDGYTSECFFRHFD